MEFEAFPFPYLLAKGVAMRMSSVFQYAVACILAAAIVAIQFGCGKSNKSTDISSTMSLDQIQAVQAQMERVHTENEAIKSKLEPFVQVSNGHFALLPGAASVASSSVISSVRSNLAEINALADKGEVTINSNRQVTPAHSASPAQTLACWRGIQRNWWGWYIGMSGTDIAIFLTAWKVGGCNSLALQLLRIPGAGPYISSLSLLYCNGIMLYLQAFNAICNGGCETATVYYWAIPTPFLNCQ